MSDRALIVIDVQNEYFPGGAWALPDAEKALPNITGLIAGARDRGEAVVFIQHVAPADSPVFAAGSPGMAMRAELKVRPEDPTFQKSHPSAFQDTGLQEFLKGAGIGRLDICGFMTQMCCDTTTREAYGRGYSLRLFHDACAARDLDTEEGAIPHDVVHRTHLASLARFAKIVTTAQAGE